MPFVYAFLMVGVTVTAITAILIYRKLSTASPDQTEAIRRLEAATARISNSETQIRQQSETVTGIEPVQP